MDVCRPVPDSVPRGRIAAQAERHSPVADLLVQGDRHRCGLTAHYFTDALTTGVKSSPFCAIEFPRMTKLRTRIHDVAALRLRGTQSVDVLLGAIDLAVVLRDADVRQTVAALRSEVQQRGIQAANDISSVQRQARNGLAGVPAQPRH